MDRILISLKKENGPMASSAPALGLNTIIFKHVYWYMQQTQVSVYRTIGPLVKYSIASLGDSFMKTVVKTFCNLSVPADSRRGLFIGQECVLLSPGLKLNLKYCRSGNIRESLIFANIRELVASQIQSSG